MTMVVDTSPPGQHEPRRPLTLRQRGLVQVLAELSSDGRTVYRSIAEIAERAESSRRAILRLLVELEDAGAIRRDRDVRQPQAPTRITLTYRSD